MADRFYTAGLGRFQFTRLYRLSVILTYCLSFCFWYCYRNQPQISKHSLASFWKQWHKELEVYFLILWSSNFLCNCAPLRRGQLEGCNCTVWVNLTLIISRDSWGLIKVKNGLTFVEPDMTQKACAVEGFPSAQPSSLESGERVCLPVVCFQSPRAWTKR